MAAGQNPTPPTLPSATGLVFVSDESVDLRTVRPGSHFRVHLQSDLVLGPTVLAAAGTPADLLIVDVVRSGTPAVRIALQHFSIKAAQTELPVVPIAPLLASISPGVAIPAQTVGTVVSDGHGTFVRIPLPFPLSTDAPDAFYTALPARTTAPLIPRRRPTPSPAPSEVPATASPAPAAASPVPSGSP